MSFPGVSVYTLAIALGANREAHKSKLAAKTPMIFDPVLETEFRGSRNVFGLIRHVTYGIRAVYSTTCSPRRGIVIPNSSVL
jgi:hypothetical protein